jgi:hypothetical protein
LIGAVTSDGEVSLFDFDTLELVRQIRPRGAPPGTIAFSANSTILATLSTGHPLALYSKEGPPQEIPLPGGLQAGQFRFAPNGRLIAVAGSAEVPLFDIQKRAIVRRLVHPVNTRDLVFVEDSCLLASCRNGSLYRWSVEDGRMTGRVPLQAGEIYDLAVSPDRRLAAVRGFHEIKVVDLSEMNIVASLPSRSDAGGVSFLGGGRTLLIDESKSQPTLWQTGIWQRVGQIEMPDVHATSASSDGLRLVTWRFNGLSTIDARVDAEQDRRLNSGHASNQAPARQVGPIEWILPGCGTSGGAAEGGGTVEEITAVRCRESSLVVFKTIAEGHVHRTCKRASVRHMYDQPTQH